MEVPAAHFQPSETSSIAFGLGKSYADLRKLLTFQPPQTRRDCTREACFTHRKNQPCTTTDRVIKRTHPMGYKFGSLWGESVGIVLTVSWANHLNCLDGYDDDNDDGAMMTMVGSQIVRGWSFHMVSFERGGIFPVTLAGRSFA